MVRLTLLAIAAVLMFSSTMSAASCQPTRETLIVEIVVNSCDYDKAANAYRVQAQVTAEASLPFSSTFLRTQTTPLAIPTRHFNPPESRAYYYRSISENACKSITARSPLLMLQTAHCCDAETTPMCKTHALMNPPPWLVQLGAGA